MIVIAGALLGIITGTYRAKRRGGNGKDMAQYAAVHAMLFMVIGLFITLIIHRSAL